MIMMANVSFVLLKINDIDVVGPPRQQQQQPQQQLLPPSLSLSQQRQHDVALSLLLSEETENIVLQLKRKSCWPDVARSIEDVAEDGVDLSKRLCFLKLQHGGPDRVSSASDGSVDGGAEIVMSLHLPEAEATSRATQTDDMAFYVHEQLRNIQKDTERLIEEEHNLFEQSLAPDIDIEEITLRKTHSNERLGLTVCYSNGEEYGDTEGGGGGGSASGNEVYTGTGVTEVYISDIHADSVAGRDGRLRQGDQILQINGKDITNREETETLIAENNNAVTLLVSRYLYGEDDFNDPSTNEDDDEVLVVEDDEDEDDEEEFYDENNMTYVNCVANNECALNNVDDFDKAIMSQVDQPQVHGAPEVKDDAAESCIPTAIVSKTVSSKPSKSDRKSSTTLGGSGVVTSLGVSSSAAENKTSDYYESEHIYETIPEDPESEPFYCSPYDSSVYVTAIASCSSSTATTDALQQQMPNKQRVVQWLGINSTPGSATQRQLVRNATNNCNRSLRYRHKSNTSSTGRSTMTSLTNGSGADAIGSAMTLPASAHVDDQDNSSSAYNTGGSNNSVSPHSLVLNSKGRGDGPHHPTHGCQPLVACNSGDDMVTMQHLLLQHKLVSQQKILSPKDKNKITSPKSSNKLPLMDMPGQMGIATGVNAIKPLMYSTNEVTNVQRTMMMQQQQQQQQHAMKQSLSMDKSQSQTTFYHPHQMQDPMHCPPQFTAPNLSQYHFVSSQEVNNLSLNNKIPKSSPTVAETSAAANNAKNASEEEAMVWKVKRRPDGTRYIVRRPAKSRNIKERSSARLNIERLRDENTTTEDDNMSEVKTGRYWTREERKKHIEKAKERRQQQQQQTQHQLLQQQLQQKALETSNDLQQRERMRQAAHFLSFSREKYRQHYQLQFNSVEGQKHKQQQQPPNYQNNSAMGLEDSSAGGAAMHSNMEQCDIVANMGTANASSNPLATGAEHSINSTIISVTTV